MNTATVARTLGWLLLAGYAALTLWEALRYFKSALTAPLDAPAVEVGHASRRRVLLEVLAAFIASRLLVALVCAAGWWIDSGSLSGFFGAVETRLYPWDARHYIDIIEHGYVTGGDARLFIVFFPFYPLACRCVTLLTGLPAAPVAFGVSNLALIGCGGAMWRLAERDGGEALGRRAMLLLMFCPLTYYYSVTYSESMFLLLTLLAVLCARRRRFVLAVTFGAMASGARLVGMATAIPIFWELLAAYREEKVGREAALTGRELARAVALCVAKTLPVSLGFLAYLHLNWRLFGNPTQFMVFQREHWFQRLGTIGNTLQYSLVNALEYDDFLYRLGVWWPQVALLIATPLLVLWQRKRQRPGDVAYTLVYHYVSFSPTWLLSGPRYASCNYALYPLLAGIPRRRRDFILLLALEGVLLIAMTWLGLWKVRVY